MNESSVCWSLPSSGATDGSSSPRTQPARSLICIAHASAMLTPLIFEERAPSLSRVPSHSGQVVNVIARSTKARMCGCIASRSLDRKDFWIDGMRPLNVRLMPSTLIFVGSRWSRSCSSFFVYFLIGLSGSKYPQPRKIRPNQPSMLYPGMVSAPSLRDLLSSYSAVRSKSVTAPRPSHRGHMPPVMLKLRRSLVVTPAFSMVTAPAPEIEATLKEYACGEPMCGSPSRLKRIRSMALASVAVPTVDRGSAPIRSWSTRMAVVRPSSTSTSGRARAGMKPWTNALYVSLIIRWDSAAMVPNTSELLPDPETPVNTVSRRFGISTLTSLRLLTRAPCTRIRSWLSAACVFSMAERLVGGRGPPLLLS